MTGFTYEKETTVRASYTDLATKILVDGQVIGLIFAPKKTSNPNHFGYYKIGFYTTSDGMTEFGKPKWSKWRGGWNTADDAIEFLESNWRPIDIQKRYNLVKFKTR